VSHEDVIGYRLAPVYPRDQMYEVDPDETVQNDWLLDAAEETAFWNATAETGATVTLLVQYEQLDQVLELVERYPELNYVIDHMARISADIPFDSPYFATFEKLAEYDNVLVKASALGFLSQEGFPFSDMENYVRWMLNTFGQERVAWGSDFPFVSSVGVEYAESLECLDHFDSLSTSDYRWLTGRAFKRFVDI
jgi:predicted TIM-barrel fold metal-dependent hydrolase